MRHSRPPYYWHDWFAWYPVRVARDDGITYVWCWLHRVLRRRTVSDALRSVWTYAERVDWLDD